jgi:hypothetical protein
LAQNFETVNSVPFAGKTVTLSFYARKGANYSPTSSALAFVVQTGTGTDQAFTGYTGTAYPINATATLTTTWQRFTATAALSSSITELAVLFVANVTGTAGANDYFEVTGVQLEVGSVATPFHTYAATIQGELAACQRYYYRTTSPANFSRFGLGQVTGTTTAYGFTSFPVSMRIVPTALEQTGGPSNYAVTNSAAGAVALSAGPSFDSASFNGALSLLTVSAGLIAGNSTQFLSNNNTTSYLGWSAEL